jgi:hypothetical protein
VAVGVRVGVPVRVGVRVRVGVWVIVGVKVGAVGVAVGVRVAVRVLYTNAFTTAMSPKVGWLSAVKPPTMLAPITFGSEPSMAAQSKGAPVAVAGPKVGIGTGTLNTEW